MSINWTKCIKTPYHSITHKYTIPTTMKLLSLFLLFTFLTFCSHVESNKSMEPKLIESLKHENNTKAINGYVYYYSVTIKSSCDSTYYTKDQIDLQFGDANGNKVSHTFPSRAPGTDHFAACSEDTFSITGSLITKISYAYLRRVGSDGWLPASLKIQIPSGETSSYTYNLKENSLPESLWVGFNNCCGNIFSNQEAHTLM